MAKDKIKPKKKNKAKKDPELEKALATFKQAMLDSDKTALENLISDKVHYGHSDGMIEGKSDFIHNIHTGKYSFTTFDILNPKITLFGKTGLIRHALSAETNDNNVPSTVNLSILLVWRKEKGTWKLIARQAVKSFSFNDTAVK